MFMSSFLNGMINEDHESYEGIIVPDIDIDTERTHMIMINEAVPTDKDQYFYSGREDSEYANAAIEIFRRAGKQVDSMDDILRMGVYVTSAVKCPKKESTIDGDTIKKYSFLLEKELELFKNLKVIMLMGDVAKKSMNMITKRNTGKNVIPSISTYKIRDNEYFYDSIRVMPSYIMTGPNLLIEKSKMDMIIQDVGKALSLVD
ncbi:MAG TPA: uracil-DNA glycosylase family protein [Lachnospiraceae bacterium]|nr:uracil-DNA glycosylase family protein [Lachnospiraceae bacterium]